MVHRDDGQGRLLSESLGHPHWQVQRLRTHATTTAPSSPARVPATEELQTGLPGVSLECPPGLLASRLKAPGSPQASLTPPRPQVIHFSLHLSHTGNNNDLEETREVGSLKWRRRSRETFPNFQKELFGIINQHITNTKELFHIRRHIIKETIEGLLCILFLKNANYV